MKLPPDPAPDVAYIDRIAAGALAALLAVTPWPLGSRLAWADTWTATSVLAIGGIWLGGRLFRGPSPRWPTLTVPMSVFLAVVGFQLLMGLSVYPFGTGLGLRSHAAYAVVLLVTFDIGQRAALRRFLTAMLLAVGASVAVFAVVQHLTWNGSLFWFYEPPMGGTSPFGPFNNRNYHAGYMMAAIGPALGLMLSARSGTWRWLAALCFTIGAASVALSLSRGGLLALAASSILTVVVATTLRRTEAGSRPRSWFLVPAGAFVLAVSLVAGVVYWLGDAQLVIERLQTFMNAGSERSVGGRLEIWRDTMRMIADRPFLGFGLNTFVWGHLAYRSVDTGIPQHAHNEYLETVAETGLIGGAICLWFLWSLARAFTRDLRGAPAGFDTGLRLGTIAAWVGIMVYGLMDFPTVIPATNYALAALAGLACAAATDRRTTPL